MILKRKKCHSLRFAVGGLLLLLLLLLPLFAIACPKEPTIVYDAYKGKGNWDIYTMDFDGKNERRLTHFSVKTIQPTWSPDGTHIAFSTPDSLVIMDCDGNNIQKFPMMNLKHPLHPDWSPDGSQIAFSATLPDMVEVVRDNVKFARSETGIFVLNLTTGVVHTLTKHLSTNESPSWSPDGRWLVFASSRDPKFWVKNPNPDPAGPPNQFFVLSDIYLMDAEWNNMRNLTQSTAEERYPDWSPDGKKIVFVRHSANSRDDQLYVMDVESGREQRITKFGGNNIIHGPSWSSDNQWILFSKYDKEQHNLYAIRPDGTDLRQLTDNEAGFHALSPDLFVPSLSVSPIGLKLTSWGNIKKR